MRKKKSALFNDVKLHNCYCAYIHYTGTMPCTGILLCSMCGMTFRSKSEYNDYQTKIRQDVLVTLY